MRIIAKERQQRQPEGICAVVFLDAIHYHVRSEGQIVKKAVYFAIGIDGMPEMPVAIYLKYSTIVKQKIICLLIYIEQFYIIAMSKTQQI